jgi:hypothetical protein
MVVVLLLPHPGTETDNVCCRVKTQN